MVFASRCSLVALALLLIVLPARAQEQSLEMSITTDKAVYRLGEPVHIGFDVRNASSQLYEDAYDCNLFSMTIIDASDTEVARLDRDMCPGITIIGTEWLPYETKNLLDVDWEQTTGYFPSNWPYPQVTPGVYRLRAVWRGFGDYLNQVFDSEPFEITQLAYQAQVPTLSSLGTSVLIVLMAAAAWMILRRSNLA
jgi:hypothetical protein